MKKIVFVVLILFCTNIQWTFAQSGKANESEKSILTMEERLTKLENEVSELKKAINNLNGKNAKAPEGKVNSKENSTSIIKPSEENVYSAITNYIKTNVPVTWSGNLLGGRDGTASSITIIQWGNYNDMNKYWPVKVRVVGSCTIDNIMNTERRNFDKTGSFKIKLDDYGVWTAEYAESF